MDSTTEREFIMNYNTEKNNANNVISQQGDAWKAINPEYVARLRSQNSFKTGLDISKYT
jgi:isocitrate lyase